MFTHKEKVMYYLFERKMIFETPNEQLKNYKEWLKYQIWYWRQLIYNPTSHSQKPLLLISHGRRFE